MRVQFREFVLDAGSRQLLRSRQEVHLVPKAFDLLQLLLERRPDAVSREEIRDRLWPDTFVSESTLTEDLGSRNGTYDGGERITPPQALHDGDEIRIGRAVLTARVLSGGLTTEVER